MLDDRQRIVQWSYGAAALTGIPEAQAIGCPCYEVFHGYDAFGRPICRSGCPAFKVLDRGRLTGHCTLLLKQPRARAQRFTCNLTALPGPRGGAFASLLELQAPATSGAALPVASASDIAQDLAFLTSFTTSLWPERPEEAAKEALGWLRDATKAEAAELFLAEPGGSDMLLTEYCGPFKTAFTQIIRFHPGEGFPGLVLNGQAPVVTQHLKEDPRYLRTRVKEKGFRSYVCVPVPGSGGIMGSLNVAARDAAFDVGRALRVLTWASRPLGTVLEAGRLQRRLAVSAASAEFLGTTERELDALLRAVLLQMVSAGKATGGAIFLYDRDAHGLVRRMTEGESPGMACPEINLGAPEVCPALAKGHGVLLYGPRYRFPLPCQRVSPGLGAVYCLPLAADGEAVGVVQIGYTGKAPSPPTRYLPLMIDAARQAGLSIAQVWRAVQAHRSAMRLSEQWMGELRRQAAPQGALTEGGPQEGLRGKPLAGHPLLDIRCLGSFELYRQGALVTPEMFGRRGALSLLKILAVHEGRPVHRDILAGLLWPEADPKALANRVYVLVHALRQVIEPSNEGKRWRLVCSDRDRYYLNLHSSPRLDIREFREYARLGERLEGDSAAGAIDSYEAAVDLYRGDLLEDEPYAEWCWEERESLREMYLSVLRRLGALHMHQGEPDKSVEVYRRALRADPLREDMHQGLMRALWAAGRRDEALRQYQVCNDIVVRELGVAPLPETLKLYETIRHNPLP